MKKIFTIFVFAILVASAMFVSAAAVEKVAAKSKGGAQIIVPSHAINLGNGVFHLGYANDINGELVEGRMHVYKKENAKPDGVGNGGKKDKGGSSCYSHLAKGARWKNTEDYVFGPAVDAVSMEAGMSEWENEVSDFEIFGNLDTVNVVDGDDQVSPDGKNEVMHANLGATSTIAYTITWGRFGGNPNNRVLSEWDMVFNDAFSFGDGSVNPNVMDYHSIASHELGHALGMGHSPTDSGCVEETMYPTAGFGETNKRDLHTGDIEGVVALY